MPEGLIPCLHGLNAHIGALVLYLVCQVTCLVGQFLCMENETSWLKCQVPYLEFQPPDMYGHVPCLDIEISYMECEVPHLQSWSPCLKVESPHMECQVPVLWMEGQIITLRFAFPQSEIQFFHILGQVTYLENQILLLQISSYECKTLYPT